jgi:hypothetical protein
MVKNYDPRAYEPGLMPKWIAESYGDAFKREWLAGVLRQDSDTGRMYYVYEVSEIFHGPFHQENFREVEVDQERIVRDLRRFDQLVINERARLKRDRKIRELIERQKRRESRSPEPVLWISATRERVASMIQSTEIPFSEMEPLEIPAPWFRRRRSL